MRRRVDVVERRCEHVGRLRGGGGGGIGGRGDGGAAATAAAAVGRRGEGAERWGGEG